MTSYYRSIANGPDLYRFPDIGRKSQNSYTHVYLTPQRGDLVGIVQKCLV